MGEPKTNAAMRFMVLNLECKRKIGYIILIASVQNISWKMNGIVIIYSNFLEGMNALTIYVNNCHNFKSYNDIIDISTEMFLKISVSNLKSLKFSGKTAFKIFERSFC